ncbi:hypothetical protein ABID22_002471 [Pontibacter aydingkolensis]|uniref:LytTr DNA-binding domain-containing protein n=1 Tax=Pontibacter aydingkolensis TaxID=1911536 RepID=A0ABS7CW36_9BACT|nr:hypothetical protein [Pontibacter aydingkolensis]MBW7468071.1 hypothetical protein [Pontibacter aydingkolensis]
MNTLPINWLTEGLIDFEYKKYLLLAYLQAAKEEFGQQRLYPVFSDLIMHYRNLLQVKEHKKLVYESFPQRISRADFEKLELVYEKIVADDETMQQIEEIIQYASPLFGEAVESGKELYDFVERHLEISPVGITPIYHNEGYLFLEAFPGKETQVYMYRITVFENTYEKYRGINTQHLQTVRRGLAITHENLKVRLLRERQELPNPATFAIVSKIPVPLEHSLLPIAKRSLVKYVAQLAA